MWATNEYLSLIEVLVVKGCPKLIELPFSSYTCYPPERDSNVTWFPRLKALEIQDCPKLLSLPPIPYSHTLCSVRLRRVGRALEWLDYSHESRNLRIVGSDALHRL